MRPGIYARYANANVDVSGLVTNEAATGYVLRHTGGLNLMPVGRGPLTHYGPGDWYSDAVAQATGRTKARRPRSSPGLIPPASAFHVAGDGYPISAADVRTRLQAGAAAQIVWQRCRSDDANDGLGSTVALGTTLVAPAGGSPARPVDHRQRQRQVVPLCACQSVARSKAGDDDAFRRPIWCRC